MEPDCHVVAKVKAKGTHAKGHGAAEYKGYVLCFTAGQGWGGLGGNAGAEAMTTPHDHDATNRFAVDRILGPVAVGVNIQRGNGVLEGKMLHPPTMAKEVPSHTFNTGEGAYCGGGHVTRTPVGCILEDGEVLGEE